MLKFACLSCGNKEKSLRPLKKCSECEGNMKKYGKEILFTDKEKEDYKKLKSDSDRIKFIEEILGLD